MQLLEQILQKTCKDEQNLQYQCESTYLAKLISQGYKFDEKELILVGKHAEDDFEHGGENHRKEIYARYGTDGCHKNFCLAPFIIDRFIKLRHMPDYVFPDLREASRYKYFESQKEGHDIGLERAMTEWAQSPLNPGFAGKELEKKHTQH